MNRRDGEVHMVADAGDPFTFAIASVSAAGRL